MKFIIKGLVMALLFAGGNPALAADRLKVQQINRPRLAAGDSPGPRIIFSALENHFKWRAGRADAFSLAAPAGPEAPRGGDPAGLPRIRLNNGLSQNSLSEAENLIIGARLEVRRRPFYRSAYYRGGYPPATEGVCTDLVWRAFQHAGYDLKTMMDEDIKRNTSAYPRVNGQPDPNIDFRRVPNQLAFFKRHGQSLTRELIPGDRANLAQWRPGDIVTFQNPDHIAILSNKRNSRGAPYLLHNDGPVASEADDFLKWRQRGVTGHFRFPKK